MIDEIELLRRARPAVDPPSEHAARIARESLDRAVAQGQRGAGAKRGTSMGRSTGRVRLGPLAAGAGVLLVVAIVAVFLGVRGSSPRTTSGGATTTIRELPVPAGTPAGARFVVAQMAALRRPQTSSDRFPASVSEQLKNDAVGSSMIPSLTRLAATVNVGSGPLESFSVYAIVEPQSRGYPVEIATALVVGRERDHKYLVVPPEVVDVHTALETRGLTPDAVATDNSYELCGRTWCKGEPLPGGEPLTVAVVPDGVTRVKWVFARFRHPGTVTVYPRVENNVAVSTAVPGTAELLDATWYGADGRVITPITIPQPTAPRRPVPAIVGRSFAALRGVPANHGVAIANDFGMRLSLVPHPTQLCVQYTFPSAPVAITAGAGGCVPISMALAGNFTLGLFGKGETLIGVAPNGNRTVTLTVLDLKTKVRSRRVVHVSQNVYVARTPHLFETVALKDANGVLRTWRTP